MSNTLEEVVVLAALAEEEVDFVVIGSTAMAAQTELSCGLRSWRLEAGVHKFASAEVESEAGSRHFSQTDSPPPPSGSPSGPGGQDGMTMLDVAALESAYEKAASEQGD